MEKKREGYLSSIIISLYYIQKELDKLPVDEQDFIRQMVDVYKKYDKHDVI